MESFKLEIRIGNDACQSSADVARLLIDLGNALIREQRKINGGPIQDENGNTVGHYSLKDIPEVPEDDDIPF